MNIEPVLQVRNVSIIGLGLIGGSIARALKNSGLNLTVSGYDRAEIIRSALKESVIDIGMQDSGDIADADLIFLCLPVDVSLETLERIAPRMKKDAILTDVCGVKGVLQDRWESVPSKGVYIGGHPMTGKERGGFANSDPLLFENVVYLINDRAELYSQSSELYTIVRRMGARIKLVDPYFHDRVVANVSHMPQMLSVALVNSVSNGNTGQGVLDFAAGGFRDMTRIASSDFEMWRSVIKQNRGQIIDALDSLVEEIDQMRSYVRSGDLDKVAERFEQARVKRDEIPRSTKGFLSPLYDIFIFVQDVPGIVSRISTCLYEQGINIKDIELLKIREGTGGTFRLSFESAVDAEHAEKTIRELGFTIK